MTSMHDMQFVQKLSYESMFDSDRHDGGNLEPLVVVFMLHGILKVCVGHRHIDEMRSHLR